jgi:hypothetical protein
MRSISASDIKDFLEVLLPIEPDADWQTALDVLAEYRGVEVVPAGPWMKLIAQLSGVVRSGVLVQMVRHIDKDPSFTPMVRDERHRIVEGQLNILKTQVEASMHKLVRELKGKKVGQMVKAVFGGPVQQRVRHYSEKTNEEFTKRMVAGFSHTEAVNYLATFLLEYFETEVRIPVSELFIVRATWSDNTISSQLSESFYGVLSGSESLQEFDSALSPDGELGVKLKKSMGPIKTPDKSSPRLLRQTCTT